MSVLSASHWLAFARSRVGLARRPVVLPAHAAYERWAPSYPPVAFNPVMRAEQQMVARLLAPLGPSRVLDVGTGSGRYLPLLASTGARVVLGIDFSLAMLARVQAGGHRICGDACRLPFRRGTFDLVNASLMLGDVADLAGWAGEMWRVLQPGGHLICSDFHPSWASHGWHRTFRALDGRTVVVPYVAHSIEDHLAALEGARFEVAAIREPRLVTSESGVTPVPGTPDLDREQLDRETDASVKAFHRRWGNPPVVVVFHAIKESAVRAARAPGRSAAALA